MRKRRVSEPGYRWVKEREKYLALNRIERHKVKRVLEEIWQGKGCDGVHKGRLPCPDVKNT